MKVSRKVWRRKHSRSSSISCRRLRSKKSNSGYKKKNGKTQKGGKRGRSYKRMRVHTHKRGKRFHKGGVGHPCKDTTIPVSTKTNRPVAEIIKITSGPSGVTFPDPTNENVVSGLKYEKCFAKDSAYNTDGANGIYWLKISRVTLKNTKKTGTLNGAFNKKGVPSPFEVVIIKIKEGGFEVILTRQDENVGKYNESVFSAGLSLEVYFMIHTRTLDELEHALTDATKLEKMESNQNHIYDFNFNENQPYFNYITQAANFLERYTTQVATQKANDEKAFKDAVINEAKSDDLVVTLADETRTFGDFKKEFIELAQYNKQKLDDSSLLSHEVKETNKKKIDNLLLQILLARYKLMRIIFFQQKSLLNWYDNSKEELTKALLKQTESVRTIVEELGNGNDPTNFNRCIVSIQQLISSMGTNSQLDTEQKQKLEQALQQPPVQNVAVLALQQHNVGSNADAAAPISDTAASAPISDTAAHETAQSQISATAAEEDDADNAA